MSVRSMAEKALQGRIIDLDALSAAESEATSGEVAFEYNGRVYTVSTDLNFRVFIALHDEDIIGAVQALLGLDQAEALLAEPGLKLRHINTLIQEVTKAASGTDLGEASGSPAASKRTTKK